MTRFRELTRLEWSYHPPVAEIDLQIQTSFSFFTSFVVRLCGVEDPAKTGRIMYVHLASE